MLRNGPLGMRDALSLILVRQSFNRCHLLLPITGMTSTRGQTSKAALLDYSSLPLVGQPLNDNCNQNCVGRTTAADRIG
jgi:hypothetical protein